MTRKEHFDVQKERLVKWLRPGTQVKRRLVMLFLGILFLSLGMGYEMVHLYRSAPFPAEAYYVTLQFIDRFWCGVLFIAAGVALSVLAVRGQIVPSTVEDVTLCRAGR